MVDRSNQFFRQEVKEITVFIIFGLIVTVLIPLFFGFALRGFEESFVQGKPLEFGSFLTTYLIYYIFIFASIIGLTTLKVNELLITSRGESPPNQSRPTLFGVAYLHDPEQDGLLYNAFDAMNFKIFGKNPMYFTLSMLRMFIIGTLIFGSLGLLQITFPQAQFTAIPQITFQQITPAMEVYFAAEPPAFAETFTMVFIFSLLMGFSAGLISKFKLGGKVTYFSVGILLTLFVGVIWMLFHSISYGNSDAALFATFIFGFFGALLTLLTGTAILWYTWHFWNNVFAKLAQTAPGNEDIIFISAILLILLFVFWIGTEFALKRFRKKRQVTVVVPQ